MSPVIADTLWIVAGIVLATAAFVAWWELPRDDD